jgi:hypothetical protein
MHVSITRYVKCGDAAVLWRSDHSERAVKEDETKTVTAVIAPGLRPVGTL